MKVNIWSDIRCPFCYIGKRKFEMALEKFQHKDDVEVIWHSFQLDPTLKTQPDLHAYDYLAEIKGKSREQMEEMHEYVKGVAKEVGLDFNFDNAVVANSFNGHRLIQLAKSKNLGNEAEEALFRAHFTDGKNIDDRGALLEIGVAVGLPKNEVEDLLNGDLFSEEVKADEMQARSIGIRSVPFFVLNNKFAVSGAQAPELFFQALQNAWQDMQNPVAS